jgi:hypothetical protein
MKYYVLIVLWFMLALNMCSAQTICDSLYSKEDKFREGKIGLILFDVPPVVTTGKEKLINYTGRNDKVGFVAYRVVIDELGNPFCLKFSGASNPLIVDGANKIVQELKFSPALVNGKAIRSTMSLIVRFYETQPAKVNKRRKQRA